MLSVILWLVLNYSINCLLVEASGWIELIHDLFFLGESEQVRF